MWSMEKAPNEEESQDLESKSHSTIDLYAVAGRSFEVIGPLLSYL